MVSQDPLLSDKFHSVAQQMLEAIEKSSKELSQTVNKSVEQLCQYNLSLQKLFAEQLRQAHNKQQLSISHHCRGLVARKEKCLQEVDVFERAHIETIVATGEQVRQSLDKRAQACQDKLAEIFGSQSERLKDLVVEPKSSISELAKEHMSNVKATSTNIKEQIDTTVASNEELLSEKIKGFSNEIQRLIDEEKQLIHNTLEKAQKALQDKTADMREQLDALFQENLSELSETLTVGEDEVHQTASTCSSMAQSSFSQWHTSVNQLNSSYVQFLQDFLLKHKETHQSKLDCQLGEAKDKIVALAQSAHDKSRLTHTALRKRLEELTQEHGQCLAALLSRFESLLFDLTKQSSEIASMEQKTASDLKEKLRTKLTSAGAELTASLLKLSKCLETEYAKSGQQAQETIESLSIQVTESLEKQVQLLKNELKRISKTFQDELDHLEGQVAEIEASGRKASEMVMTYKSAFLSLGDD